MPANHAATSQIVWARVAGFMYWAVLVVDLTGMRLHSPDGHTLMLTGSILTIPLALGLYNALKPVQATLAASALLCRLLEAALGILSSSAALRAIHLHLAGTYLGTTLSHIAEWDDATNFAALIFTVGSTIFFYLFVKSGYIPRVLAWWGLFSSVLALSACLTHLAVPTFPAMSMYAWSPMLLTETSTGAWLLVKAVNLRHAAL